MGAKPRKTRNQRLGLDPDSHLLAENGGPIGNIEDEAYPRRYFRSWPKLEWINERWHLGGWPIHAGCYLELKNPDGEWIKVRIESRNNGEQLLAVKQISGLWFERVIGPHDELRRCEAAAWYPEEEDRG